jgi:hypothetical protein
MSHLFVSAPLPAKGGLDGRNQPAGSEPPTLGHWGERESANRPTQAVRRDGEPPYLGAESHRSRHKWPNLALSRGG